MLALILRFTIRSFWRNRLYHFISISGLAIAIACSFFILIWVNHEVSYERFHPKAERIYRLTFEYNSAEYHSHFARCYQDWVLQIPDYFPEVEQMIRLQPMRNVVVRIGENKFFTSNNFSTDSSFFNVFGFELVRGDPSKVLLEPKSVVLSESLAKKCFGEQDPIGTPIYSGHQFDTLQHLYTVTGIMKDFPANSHFHSEMLGSLDDPKEHIGWAYIYLLLREGTNPVDMLAMFPDFLKQFLSEEQVADWTPCLQPIRDIHLHSAKDREIEQNGKALYIYIFIMVASLLLIIAFINYANLQIAAINKKLGFIFLNRVVGARIRDIIKFVAFENSTGNLLASLLGILLLILGLPVFNRSFGYQLTLNHVNIWVQIIVLTILITGLGVVIGTYPVLLLRIKEKLYQLSGRVFYHQGFNLIQHRRGFNPRKALVILQFLISVGLILSTIIIYLQVDYMLKGGIGSGDNGILVLKNLPRPVLDNYMVFKKELLQSPLVLEVSASMEEPSADVMDAMKFEMDGMDESLEDQLLNVLPVDHTFLDFYGIRLLAGRNFPEYQGMEARENYVINETALRKLGFESPGDVLNRPFKLIFQWPEIFKGGQIIGVTEDFHFHSMAKKVKPLVMFQKHIWFWCFLVRVDENNFQEAVDFVYGTWERIYPEYPFEYSFVDDLYTNLYKNEITQVQVLAIFAVLTILIACLGLVGLMIYFTEIKTKEIGIRKVNGANSFHIIFLLNRQFILWILLACLMACPIAWYIGNKWLQNFVYRIDMNWWIFVLSSLIIITLSILVISYRSVKTALINPAEILKYE